MSEPTPTQQLWFMDWYGWMLDHDPLKDAVTRNLFQPGRLPGLSAVVPAPLVLPCRPLMQKRVSMPRPFRELELQEWPDNRVVFFVPKTATYLRSVPVAPSFVDYLPAEPGGWETFLPLTLDMLRGLSLLMTPDMLKLEDEAGVFLPAPVFAEEMTLRFGDRFLPLHHNTPVLTQIGQIMPGDTAQLSLTWQDETTPTPFSAHRQTTSGPAA